MNYLELMKELNEENKGYIVLMKSGVFLTAIGKNAIKLSELFGLKLLCITDGICKCSIPTNSLDKYIVKFQKSRYSFLIYDYNKNGFKDNNENYKLISRIDGLLNEENREHLNCDECWYNKNKRVKTLEKAMQILEEYVKDKNKNE